MQFLKDTLNIDVRISGNADTSKLPYLITDRYQVRECQLDSIDVLIVSPKDDVLAGMPSLKVQLHLIASLLQKPTVLLTNGLTSRQRKRLIEDRQAFIVPNTQIYLPFLGVLLQERFARPQQKIEKLSGLGQMALLYCIENHLSGFSISDIADKLGYTKMSISRVAKELEQLKLVTTEKAGRNKRITFTAQGKVLFQKAEPFLINPVRKKVYIPEEKAIGLPMAGLTALSEMTMINDIGLITVASNSLKDFEGIYAEDDTDDSGMVSLEIWKYNPAILAQGGYVDTLSLLLSFKDDTDARTQGQVEVLMERFWEKYDSHGA